MLEKHCTVKLYSCKLQKCIILEEQINRNSFFPKRRLNDSRRNEINDRPPRNPQTWPKKHLVDSWACLHPSFLTMLSSGQTQRNFRSIAPKHEALITASLKEWSCSWKQILFSLTLPPGRWKVPVGEREEETDEAGPFSPEARWKL